MSLQLAMAEVAAELALFAALGFFHFSLDDLAVDLTYFGRRMWRSNTEHRCHARGDARSLVDGAAIARLAAAHGGKPFADGSMTEDYEMGLRLGTLGERTIFVRLPASRGERGVVASHGHFPSDLGAAVRHKAMWLGGIAFAGWDRLGWRGRLGERWFRLRDRRGPIAAVLLLAGYASGLLWAQLWLAAKLGAPLPPQPSELLAGLLQINFALLFWRIIMRIAFTSRVYGFGEGLASVPRIAVANLIAILATARAVPACGRRAQAVGQDRPRVPGG